MYSSISPSKWLIAILFIVIQCKALDSSNGYGKELENLISENIGGDYQCTTNQSKTFVLCVQNIPSLKIGMLNTNFIVVELKTNRIVEKGKYLNGHCKWLDDSSIEVVDMPGTIKENPSSDFKKIISITTPKL